MVNSTSQQRVLRRNHSLKQTISPTNVNQDENHNKDSHESNTSQVDNPEKNDQFEDNDEDEGKEEFNISGCRRRIQNRPSKRNSKSKSFCEQRKLRSHSPLPLRKQKQKLDFLKDKVRLIYLMFAHIISCNYIYNYYS